MPDTNNRERQFQDPNDQSGLEKGGYSNEEGGTVNDFARMREHPAEGKDDRQNTLEGEKKAMRESINPDRAADEEQ